MTTTGCSRRIRGLARLRPSLLLAMGLVLVWAAGRIVTASDSRAETRTPQASVIDGDSIQLGSDVVQLYGIDAPELGQRCFHDEVWDRCGLAAAFALRKLIGVEGAPLHCESAPATAASAARVCFVGRVDLARDLLKSGYVVTAPDTTDQYREAEAAARQAKLGLWHSRFTMPGEWRAGHRLPAESAAEADPCPVIAVRQADGERVYYVPTDDAYRDVMANGSTPDGVFCSDEAAHRAGWHHAGERTAGSLG